ncbi:MAG TPA: translocation/assembly module TamB domain-containing protein [Kofleriaceae bacterium]|nr:translocation/assembly module TamB domain-containing protein [Kofleriaceae bacterium]
MLLLLGAGFAVLRVEFEGPDLGDKVATSLNKRMRGRISIGSIEWPTGGLKKVLTGGWVPLTLRDVRVWDDCALNTGASALDEIRTGDPNEDCTLDEHPDPDPNSRRKPRKLLLRTDLVTAEIDVHALMFGNHDFVFRNVWVHGGEALLEQTREPYPLHAYDRTIVSIVTAFYPRMKAGFRAGIYADSPPPIFDVRDIHVKDLNLTVHMTPYGGTADRVGYVTVARLEGVDVDAGTEPKNDSYLYMDPIDPLVAKFYVRLGVTAKKGVVRMWDEGPRDAFRIPNSTQGPLPEQYPPAGRKAEYEIGLADIVLHRLAQLPGEWPRKDYVANTLEVDLEARTLPCPSTRDREPDPKTGAALHVTGELHNYWDRPYDGSWNLALDAKNMGPTIRSCIKSTIGGENLDGTITLTGPFVASPKVGLAMTNLDFDVPLNAKEEPLRLTLAEVQGSIDLVNEQGSIDKTTALIRGGKEPGEVVVSANFGLKPYNARAHVEIVKPIDVGRFLPAGAKPVGKFLQGRLTAVGDAEVGFALEDFDLALGATPKERAIRAWKGRLFTNDDFDTIRIQDVHVEAGQSRAVVRGLVDILHDDMDIMIDGNFPDLGVWLKRFGLPQFVTSAGGGQIRIKGPISNPTVNVATELGGVPCLDKVRVVRSEISNNIVDAEVTSAGLGGTLKGDARIRLSEKGGPPPVIERLHLDGKKLDATKLCGLKNVKGTIDSVDVDLAGSIDPKRSSMDWLSLAKVHAKANHLTILGDKFSNVGVCLNQKDDRICRPRTAYLDGDDLAQCEQGKRTGFCAVATATRDGGGLVDATISRVPGTRVGRSGTGAKLGGTVALSDVPVSLLDQLLGNKTQRAGGLASVTLHLQGSPDAPQATGAIQLLRAWVEGSFIGDAQLAVEPATIGKQPAIAFKGTALAGRLGLSGTVGTAAPYPVELVINGRRLELDVLMDLQKRLGLPLPVQAWMTGTVTVRTELAPVKPVEPEAWIELSELVGIATHTSEDGRITPLRVRAIDQDRAKRPAVSLRVTPSSVDFACRDASAPGGRVDCTTKLEIGAQGAKPAGVIDFRGHVTPQHMAIEAQGKLDLAPIQPLVETMFEDISGTADIAASISGTFRKPNYEASLVLKDIMMRPVGGDTVLEAPSGLVKLANGSLGFTNVKLQVRDPHRDEAGELHVKGNIELAGLTPVSWGVLIDGKVAGKMLLVGMPNLISQASGLARIDGNLMLTGKGPRPTIQGTLRFDPPPACQKGQDPNADDCLKPGDLPRAFTVIPRGLRREVALSRGSIDIETDIAGGKQTYRLRVNEVGAVIDGEGYISGLDGHAELRDGVLHELQLELDADSIPFRVPGTLDLVLEARSKIQDERGLVITKTNESAPIQVRGEIAIIDGTYRQNFELTDRIRSLGTNAPPTKPFWDFYPPIGAAELDVAVDVRRFSVKSNIASIDLAGGVRLTGTPKDPRLAGQINVTRGRFRMTGTRAAFTNTRGSIIFAENQRAGNPELRVTSDADYRDQSGQDHLITLTIWGWLDQLQWDLKTSTGYNKSQTVSLLLLGRNPEQLRRSLGDQSLGSDPTRVDPTTNPSQGFADQIVKDLAGDWVSDLLENSLTKITGLDVLRIEIGFGSIGFHLEKKVLENMNVLGTTEQTIRGSTINVRGEFKTPLNFSVQGGYLSKNFNDPAEQDIEDWNLKFVKRLFIP